MDWTTFHLVDGVGTTPFTEAIYAEKSIRTYSTFPTRGCPYKCSYCINSYLNSLYPGSKPVRKRSAENVIAELEYMKSRLPFMHAIKFDDDAFFVQKDEEIEQFAALYKQRVGMRLFVAGATPATLSRRKLDAMVDCNIITIRMGIQSFSENSKAIYNRKHSNARILEATDLLADYASRFVLPPRYDIILDNPWESDEDVVETIRHLARIKQPYKLSVFSLRFFPGSDLYDAAVREGIIRVDEDLSDHWASYHDSSEKYLNRVVYLLSNVSRTGFAVPRWYVDFMCSPKVRNAPPFVGRLLIELIYTLSAMRKTLLSAGVHAREAWSDLRKGDTSRIRRFMLKPFKRLRPS
jgi:anaerobic magnesium-protoporphyrin IX monomethyl ester cyclase